MTGPIRDAKFRIDLDTQDAEDRIDQLEEKLKEIQGDLDDADEQSNETGAKAGGGRNVTNQLHGAPMRPGKFGMRTLSNATSGGLAGIANMIPLVGGLASKGVSAGLEYGAGLSGLFSRFEKWYNDRADRARDEEAKHPGWRTRFGLTNLYQSPFSSNAKSNQRTVADAIMSLEKQAADFDLKLKTFQSAQEAALDYIRAVALTGGHVDASGLSKFARQEYDWAFVQARKDKDVRDKAMRILGEQAPNVLKDLWTSVQKGSFAP